MILKTYFKRESLVAEVFNNYMRPDFLRTVGNDSGSFNLNVQASRLILAIQPGLEVGPLQMFKLVL